MTRFLTAASFALAFTATPFAASAQGTGAEGYFQLYNATEGNVLVGFYTSPDGGENYTGNWLEVAVFPGENGQATLPGESGPCDQIFVASWLGGDGETEVFDDPISINICEASNVYLGDNEIYYD